MRMESYATRRTLKQSRFFSCNRSAKLALALLSVIVPCWLWGLPFDGQGVAKPKLEAIATRQRAALAANPKSPELHGDLGRTLLALGRYEEATEELGIAANELPASRLYNMALAEALLGWEHWGVAIDFLNAVRDRFQGYAEFHYYLGLAKYQVNKSPEALPEFEQALRLDPKLSLAKYGLAACRATGGDLQGAAELSRDLVKKHPQNARYWLALAQVLDSMGDNERVEALQASRRALALRPGEPAIELKTAVILMRLEKYLAARPLLEHVVKVQPKNTQAHVALAGAYAHLGNRELARKQSDIVAQLEKSKAESVPDFALPASPEQP